MKLNREKMICNPYTIDTDGQKNFRILDSESIEVEIFEVLA